MNYSKSNQTRHKKTKKSAINKKANKKLKKIYKSKGIIKCEICKSKFALSWHHRQKRRFLTNEQLSRFDQTILVCAKHHDILEKDRNLTKLIFKQLRG